MLPLDKFSMEILSDAEAEKFLSDSELAEYRAIPEEEREGQLREILTKPIHSFTPVNELYFRWKWGRLFSLLYQAKPFTLLEIASGDADMIPQTMDRTNPGSTYLTANQNKDLNQSLLQKTKGLTLKFQLIDDDAGNIKQYVAEEMVDMIAFQHGVNDVWQAILCGKEGVDTTNGDWMELLPKMIQLLQDEIRRGTLEESVKEPFFSLLDTLASTLKKDGIIAISHYMFQLDLDLGYPSELFEHLIPLARNWIKNKSGYEEVLFDGFDSQWWLFLKKNG